jgi:uncharacterized protein involved in exopolysaccharide biosynthesis
MDTMKERNRAQETAARVEHEEMTLLDYALVFWRYGWLIVGICVISALATFIVTVRTPKIFESTATLLAPKEGVSTGLLGGLAATGLLQQAAGAHVPSLTPNRDILVSVLKSRTLATAVVERFGLQAYYQGRYFEDAIRDLRSATQVTASPVSAAISVTVADTNPRLAAEIANFFVDELDRIIARFGTGEAGRLGAFIAGQLSQDKKDLERAEEALQRFQERNKAIVLEAQTGRAIETAARLKGEIMAAEVQLQVMRTFATEANPEIVNLRRRIEEMRRQLAEVQYGDGVVRPRGRPQAPRDRRDFTLPFTKVPELGLELARLTREVKIQEAVVNLLTQQLEQARIAEARDLPVAQILDRAVPAERHSRPRLRSNLMLAGIVSLFVGATLAFLVDYLRRYPVKFKRA